MRGWKNLKSRNDARCRTLLGRSALLDTADIDWRRTGDHELDPDAVATLVYMRDVEGFTDRDFVGLSGHPATWHDPVVVQFLRNWRAEEAEHSRALDRFLTAYGEQRGIDIPAIQPPPPPIETTADRWTIRLTRPVGHVVTAGHMAWGATNELLTLNGYRLLAEKVSHPQLRTILKRIAAQESRHYSFYVLQLEWRLAASRLARTTVRNLLARTWTPVGVGADFKSDDDYRVVMRYLTEGNEADRVVRRMNATMDHLPGLSGLELYRAA